MLSEAILAIDPNLRFAVEEDIEGDNEEKFNAVTWYNGVDSELNCVIEGEPENKPTWAEVEAELTKMRAEYDAQDYSRKRKEEYDKLNQMEMQFDDQRDGTTTWVDKINEIKSRYPK